MTNPKVSVIGGGIVGSAIALWLSRRGASVTVIEAEKPGSGATSGSFAWINAHDASDSEYFGMRMRSIGAWRDLGKELPDLALNFSGCLDWELPVSEMIDQVANHAALGHELRVMGKGEIEDFMPPIAAPDAAIWSVGDGAADPDRIAQQLLAAAGDAGADLVTNTVIGIGADGRKVVLDGGEVVVADHCVLAAGLGSVDLMKALGIALPLDASPGLIVRTDPLPNLISPVLTTPEVHVWQLSDGHLLAGADYGGTFSTDGADEAVANILAALRALFPGASGIRIADTRVTNRPMPADGRPILGPVPGYDRLSIAVMHSGVTLAPIVAALISDRILDGNEEGLAAYRLDRFIA